MFTIVNNYYLLFIQKGDLRSNIYNFSTMHYKCTICILSQGDYCKLTSREFHVKSMWRTTRESFPRKSLRNGWLKSYIKNYTENTRGINVDSLVILNLKKKIHWNFFHLKCVKHSWQSVWVWTNNLTLLLFTSLLYICGIQKFMYFN